VSLLHPRSLGKAAPDDLSPASPLVLVVDDDEVFRLVARSYLEDAGFRVEEAVNGASAVERFAAHEPDIVLLDIVMPDMDGFTTCSALRALPGGLRTPIVMMTSVDDRESIERAYEVGATDFIVKPINSFILKHRLQHILRASRYLVHFDGVTGLPKRDLFLERLEMAISSARRNDRYVAVLFLDLDDFRRFNDTLGHQLGDEILRRVADRLGELRVDDFCARQDGASDSPHPVARFGGDEFMVLLPDIRDEGDVANVALRVNESLSRPFQVGCEEVCVTASIGISAFPLDGSDPQLLLERAELAMNHAKRSGRGGFQFYGAPLNARSQARLSVEKEIRRALEREELEVHYQPRIDIQQEAVAGLEALVRIRGVEGEWLSPAGFIPVAEDTGLIEPLGARVFRDACERFLELWPRHERLGLSVNLSARQFREPGLAEKMAITLQEMEISPERIELELTEGVLLEDADSSIATLTELKDLGFRLAVDDFGTGYSSLSYLRRFPLDVIKIDRSFVQDLPNESRDAAIVEAIIELGHKLSLEIVAEGVEKRHQLHWLRSRGCDQVQGFLYSPPIPSASVGEWIDGWEAASERAIVEAVRGAFPARAVAERC
jgi:diguanylate cyclase (GGDEF)-like protein